MSVAGISIEIFGANVVVGAPPVIQADIREFFRLANPRASETVPDIVISEVGSNGWNLTIGATGAEIVVADRAALLAQLSAVLARVIPARAVRVLHCASIGWGESSAIIAGADEAMRALFCAWSVDRGFSYLSGHFSALDLAGPATGGFAGPLSFDKKIIGSISSLESFHALPSMSSDDFVVASPKLEWSSAQASAALNLVIHPKFAEGAPVSVRLMALAEARDVLKAARLSGDELSAADNAALEHLISATPAIEVTFGKLEDLNGVADNVIKLVLENQVARNDLEKLAGALAAKREDIADSPLTKPEPQKYEIQPATVRSIKAKLTIGMATYDDYDGVYFTIQSMRMHHADVMDKVEFLIIDNHPDGASAAALKQLDASASNLRYIPRNEKSGTSIKNAVFEEAQGDYVMCVDCHILLVPGAVKNLLSYFDAHPDTSDLLQGPMVSDDLNSFTTHWEPQWRGGMYGIWAPSIKPAALPNEPFDIPLMGMGLFACRKAAWPGFNPRFRGFGAEEGYIHEKFRQAGHRALCLPSLGWLHRFQRPAGIPYRNRWEDRICNYVIGWTELGLPLDDMLAHMRSHVGSQTVDRALEELRLESQML